MRDAQLLILDEPTASLDARAEFEVFGRFVDLSEGKTAVLISHRFSTVRMADRSWSSTRAGWRRPGATPSSWPKAGSYAGLFELQAAGYR